MTNDKWAKDTQCSSTQSDRTGSRTEGQLENTIALPDSTYQTFVRPVTVSRLGGYYAFQRHHVALKALSSQLVSVFGLP